MFVKTYIETPGHQGAIPSISHLAAKLGASRTTINKVLKQLVKKGVLEKSDTHNRYFIAGRTPLKKNVDYRPNKLRHSSLSALIQEDISSGNLDAKPVLPSFHDIRKKYNCSFYTAKAALEELRRTGYLTRAGHKYRVSAPPSLQSRVYLVGPGHHFISDPFLTRLAGGIEFGLRTIGWNDFELYDPDQYKKSNNNAPPDHKVAGYIYVHNTNVAKSFIPYKTKKHIPQVLIDRSNAISETGALCAHFLKLRPAHFDAGSVVARYLGSFGHRHIAFFSPQKATEPWVRERLDGIRDVFKLKSNAQKDRSCTFFSVSKQNTIDGKEICCKPIQAFLRKPEIRELLNRYFPSRFSRMEYVMPSYKMAGLLETAEALHPAFEAALKDKRITAWVGANDMVAILAMHFLQSHGIDIPGDLSLAGFDNDPISMLFRLTTYDFQYERIGYRAAHFLAYPSFQMHTKNKTMDMKGILLPRATVGAAAGKTGRHYEL